MLVAFSAGGAGTRANVFLTRYILCVGYGFCEEGGVVAVTTRAAYSLLEIFLCRVAFL